MAPFFRSCRKRSCAVSYCRNCRKATKPANDISTMREAHADKKCVENVETKIQNFSCMFLGARYSFTRNDFLGKYCKKAKSSSRLKRLHPHLRSAANDAALCSDTRVLHVFEDHLCGTIIPACNETSSGAENEKNCFNHILTICKWLVLCTLVKII